MEREVKSTTMDKNQKASISDMAKNQKRPPKYPYNPKQTHVDVENGTVDDLKPSCILISRTPFRNWPSERAIISLVRVSDTSAKSLKEAVLSLLMKHSINPSKIRGQSYDGASNMQGKMNGLKSLILQENPSTYSVHCSAYQLQLTFVVVAKKHKEVETFFAIITNVLNVIGFSFKRRDQLRDHQTKLLEQLLESGEIQSGKGLNQERGLQRPGDTRWGSHCKTLDNFVILFSSIVHVLGVIECEGDVNDRLQAGAFSSKIKAFEFVFLLHLMLKVLLMSNELSKTLQKKDQDIVNAMLFLDITKERLQE
uniref:Zinc finger MYM-type protein 1-like n=2 Tax=Nicotiana TaxID=4085 RepID=A0A1S4AWH7_TOBAC|nr:PREDICTED: zinc finger MYM-type protein 1-like [Nicotiana sylvestris]XP_016481049.1 PREDICTED: zinc finger MYM-type protein 1-like [Nicotiana tabacum]